ncbi:CPBP family intramembrane glutamic endopeptidase [Luteimonas sp. R10]|uniref:CPBP family intramembrane glutamic endopeptidase n=1 Tax=Luteimonas sp. R10 TaxID=3108176 RepID=UPI003089804B|nr:CPBP family intramembrane glutamic endopeptidase [Luteimonas sp. R10]
MDIDARAIEGTHRTPWPQIAAFAVIATAVAYPFRNNVIDMKDRLVFGAPFLQAVLEGIGVLIAAAILTRGFRRFWRPATYLGDAPAHALVLWGIPVAVFGALGINNDNGVDPHLFGLALGATISVYCLLEETGWRGFLQNATTPLSRWKRYLVVGSIWYVWHLSFLDAQSSLASQVEFLLILIVASYLLGSLVEKTNSVLVAASFHFVFNFLAFNQIGGVSDPGGRKLLLVGVVVLAWMPVLVHWNVRKKRLESARAGR